MVKQEDMNDSFISSVAAKKIAHILQPFISSSAGRHAQRPWLRSRYIKFEVWRWESGALWKVMAHFLDACGGDSSRRCSSKRCLMSFGDPLLRGEIGLGAGRDGPGRQRGSASALEEMDLGALRRCVATPGGQPRR